MDPLFAVAFLAAYSVVRAGAWWWSRRSLGAFVRRNNLVRREERDGVLLCGDIDGRNVRIRIAASEVAAGPLATRIEIDVRDALDAKWVFGINLEAERIWTEIDGEQVVIEPERAAALPSDPVARIEGGVMRLTLFGAAARTIEERLRQLSRVVALLAEESRADVLLCQVAGAGSMAARERALLRLLAHHPGSGGAEEALRLCAESDEPQLRLMAARHLPNRRRALIDGLLDAEDTPDAVLAAALSLAEDLEPARARAVALRILDGPPSRARRTAIRTFAELSEREVPDRLLEIAAHVNHASTAFELADAFATLGGPRSMRGLERLLRFEHRGVQRRVLAALSSSGDRATLGVLHELVDVLERTGLREEAAAAGAAIRERLGGPEGGRLSLVATASQGGLSQVSGGALSVTED